MLRDVAATLDRVVAAADVVEPVRLIVALDEVWPPKSSSAWVIALSALTRLVRVSLEADVVLRLAAVAVLVEVADVVDEASSWSEVRKAKAADANLSAGPPAGGGGSGPDRLVALCVLVEALFCPVGSAGFAALGPLV